MFEIYASCQFIGWIIEYIGETETYVDEINALFWK